MFKSLKIKSIGLGIACMAFSLSGAAHASQIQVDDGKYGKHSECDIKICDDGGKDFNLSCLHSFIEDLKDGKDCKDLKIEKLCKDDKNNKDDKDCKDDKHVCKIDWEKDCRPVSFCDSHKDKHDDGCDNYSWCGHDPSPCNPCPAPCDPHPTAVPAPASAGISGLGLLGIALLGWAKARRAAHA